MMWRVIHLPTDAAADPRDLRTHAGARRARRIVRAGALDPLVVLRTE
jgi:hypothetical protein